MLVQADVWKDRLNEYAREAFIRLGRGGKVAMAEYRPNCCGRTTAVGLSEQAFLGHEDHSFLSLIMEFAVRCLKFRYSLCRITSKT